jgi:hypothetical protein
MPHTLLPALVLLLFLPARGADLPPRPVSVTVLGRTNTAAGPAVTVALTNLMTAPCTYRYIALEPTGTGGWRDARTQPDGAASAHPLAAGASTHLAVRPPRGFEQWRMQFWFIPRGGREVTMRTGTLTLETNLPAQR